MPIIRLCSPWFLHIPAARPCLFPCEYDTIHKKYPKRRRSVPSAQTRKKEAIRMDTVKTLEEVRKQFEGDRFATENGAVIEAIGDRSATCSLVLTPSHRNAMGAVMGGTYFMLADFAFAVAANWKKMDCVSLRSDISFLAPARGETLTAKAVCVKDGRTTVCYRIDVTDGLGNLTATVTTTGYHTA